MTKVKFLELNKDQITVEIIAEIYESSLNTSIDYVDEVYTNNVGKIFVNY